MKLSIARFIAVLLIHCMLAETGQAIAIHWHTKPVRSMTIVLQLQTLPQKGLWFLPLQKNSRRSEVIRTTPSRKARALNITRISFPIFILVEATALGVLSWFPWVGDYLPSRVTFWLEAIAGTALVRNIILWGMLEGGIYLSRARNKAQASATEEVPSPATNLDPLVSEISVLSGEPEEFISDTLAKMDLSPAQIDTLRRVAKNTDPEALRNYFGREGVGRLALSHLANGEIMFVEAPAVEVLPTVYDLMDELHAATGNSTERILTAINYMQPPLAKSDIPFMLTARAWPDAIRQCFPSGSVGSDGLRRLLNMGAAPVFKVALKEGDDLRSAADKSLERTQAATYQAAQTKYVQAIELPVDEARRLPAYRRLAQVLIKLRRRPEAIEWYVKALSGIEFVRRRYSPGSSGDFPEYLNNEEIKTRFELAFLYLTEHQPAECLGVLTVDGENLSPVFQNKMDREKALSLRDQARLQISAAAEHQPHSLGGLLFIPAFSAHGTEPLAILVAITVIMKLFAPALGVPFWLGMLFSRPPPADGITQKWRDDVDEAFLRGERPDFVRFDAKDIEKANHEPISPEAAAPHTVAMTVRNFLNLLPPVRSGSIITITDNRPDHVQFSVRHGILTWFSLSLSSHGGTLRLEPGIFKKEIVNHILREQGITSDVADRTATYWWFKNKLHPFARERQFDKIEILLRDVDSEKGLLALGYVKQGGHYVYFLKPPESKPPAADPLRQILGGFLLILAGFHLLMSGAGSHLALAASVMLVPNAQAYLELISRRFRQLRLSHWPEGKDRAPQGDFAAMRQITKRTGLYPATIMRLEDPKHVPYLSTIQKLVVEGYGVPLEEILNPDSGRKLPHLSRKRPKSLDASTFIKNVSAFVRPQDRPRGEDMSAGMLYRLMQKYNLRYRDVIYMTEKEREDLPKRRRAIYVQSLLVRNSLAENYARRLRKAVAHDWLVQGFEHLKIMKPLHARILSFYLGLSGLPLSVRAIRDRWDSLGFDQPPLRSHQQIHYFKNNAMKLLTPVRITKSELEKLKWTGGSTVSRVTLKYLRRLYRVERRQELLRAA